MSDDAPTTSRSGAASDRVTVQSAPPPSGSWLIRLARQLRGVFIPTAEKLVLLVLADHADSDGVSFPSQETIAKETGLGRTKVGAAIRELERRRWITRQRILDGGRIWARTVYRLSPDGHGWAPEKRAPRGGVCVHRVADGQPSGSLTVSRPASDRQPPGGLDRSRGTDTKLPSEKLPQRSSQSEVALAREHVRDVVQGQTIALPFGDDLPPPAPKRTKADDEQAVFDAYLEGREGANVKGGKPVLDAKRRKMIQARMKEGFSLVDLCAAARGLWRSKWHVDQRRTSLDYAIRDAKAVETHREPPSGPRQDSDSWPEAGQIPEPVWRPPPPPPPPDPQLEADLAELRKLPLAELMKRQERAQGFKGYDS